MQRTADAACIVAFITEAAPVGRIVTHIGEPAEPPPIAPVRGPPAGIANLDEPPPIAPVRGPPAGIANLDDHVIETLGVVPELFSRQRA